MNGSDNCVITNISGALIVRKNKFLLGLRSPHKKAFPNVWDIFGGHVEPGESFEAALVRELNEELGIIVNHHIFLKSFEISSAHDGRKFLLHVYKVTSWADTDPHLCGDEHTKIGWFSLEQALKLDLALTEYRTLFRENMT